jgi:hypothetical protein
VTAQPLSATNPTFNLEINFQILSNDSDSSECWILSLEIANGNVNRNITLAGTSVAIFTFLLFFLYPRYLSGEIDAILFQFSLAIIVSVIFSLVISALYYYGTVLTLSLPPQKASTIFGPAEAFWLVGYSLLLLEPSLILFTVKLSNVGSYALFLWFSYLLLTLIQFKKQTTRKSLDTPSG